jgi:excisionase family DNA binding protein
MPAPASEPRDELLLTPREVAALFGVRTTTIARWARLGRVRALLTPGGHRRYSPSDIRPLLEVEGLSANQEQLEQDAVRMYVQGWSIRQVADRFDMTYGTMRRILSRHTTLRTRGGTERTGPSVNHHPSMDRPTDVAG